MPSARRIRRRPRILIFDDATSNLDGRTAEQLARTVNRLRGKVTLVVISHHLPQALAVDAVVNVAAAGGVT